MFETSTGYFATMTFVTTRNWDGIIEDYKLGASEQSIQIKHGITRVGLRKGLQKRGISRDATGVVRQKSFKKADDAAIEEANSPINEARAENLSDIGASVLIRHRKGMRMGHAIHEALATRLAEAIAKHDQIEESLIEYFGAKAALHPLQAGTFAQQLQMALAAVSLPAMTNSFVRLSTGYKNYVELERKAYRLDEEAGEKTYEDHLRELHDEMKRRKQAAQITHDKTERVAA